ncbi:UvrD-helicase domain-containing protein [Frankia sp. R43]|uniref:UvrD-helicase domain-containing protein n=1 Tax=Frankia sp. R43 TaxID=269536 RepID=UPI0009F8A06F|nr:UvrD-helicase domain-containing protein [Frankia sp. R43]
MNFTPDSAQQQVIEANDPVLLVCGGAGTGKTTTAAAAVRFALEQADRQNLASAAAHPPRARRPAPRALFLSFSRASVSQIIDRTTNILGPYQPRTEITTFHAFAWRLLRRWGNAIDMPEPRLLGEAEARLFTVDGTVRYRELLPRALDLCMLPALGHHLQSRWSLIVCDEFQDTDDRQFELLMAIRGSARLLLLADPNQCIYTNLPDAVGVGPQRLAAALALPGARQIDLLDVSHRDPTQVLPAAAAAVRRREFDHDALAAALETGRLQVRAELPVDREVDEVAAVVRGLLDEGCSVGVFSHHIDSTTGLSDALSERDINHEIVGLPECLGAAIDVQNAMVQFAGGSDDWANVEERLAVFVTSSVRGKKAPDLALMLLGEKAAPAALTRRLETLRRDLLQGGPAAAVEQIPGAHASLGLPRGASNWTRAARLLRSLFTRCLRQGGGLKNGLMLLDKAAADRRINLLTHVVGETTAPVQVMGLYQTKGREADATIVVLRSSDYYGPERYEPFEDGSNLLYVILSRARKKVIVLIFGEDLPPLIAPLGRLASGRVEPQRRLRTGSRRVLPSGRPSNVTVSRRPISS